MKKLISMSLSLALLLSLMVTATAAAGSNYKYEPFTFTDFEGITYTFDKAAVGYGLGLGDYEDQTAEIVIVPLVILKDGSNVTVSGDRPLSDRSGFWRWGVYDKLYEFYNGNVVFETGPVENVFSYGEDDFVGPSNTSSGFTMREEYLTFTLESCIPELTVFYPGPEIDLSAPSKAADIQFDIKLTQGPLLDNGVGYYYTLTNNTTEIASGYYALLSYLPQRYVYQWEDEEYFCAQLHPFDVNLIPGESMTGSVTSGFYSLSQSKLIWIAFEDKAERDSFLANRALRDGIGYYSVQDEQWLRKTFGITLLPAKK